MNFYSKLVNACLLMFMLKIKVIDFWYEFKWNSLDTYCFARIFAVLFSAIFINYSLFYRTLHRNTSRPFERITLQTMLVFHSFFNTSQSKCSQFDRVNSIISTLVSYKLDWFQEYHTGNKLVLPLLRTTEMSISPMPHFSPRALGLTTVKLSYYC